LNSQVANPENYIFAGLRVNSEVPLSGAPRCAEQFPAPDIVIRLAKVPVTLTKVDVAFDDGQCNKHEFLLNVPHVARFLVHHGKEILVERARMASDSDVSVHLLRTVFGILCHQRGIIPLHASAIDFTDGCVAFVGEPGAGKSTLVSALSKRGHQVLADDVCYMRLGTKGELQIWPGTNRIRLWEDSLNALGYRESSIQRELRRFDKYIIPTSLQRPVSPRCLHKVYQLTAAINGEDPKISQLRGAQAIKVLITNVYRIELATYMGYKPAAFVACASVANEIPVFQFSRPMNFNALHEMIDSLDDHLRQTG
jgi:hypothetical protein